MLRHHIRNWLGFVWLYLGCLLLLFSGLLLSRFVRFVTVDLLLALWLALGSTGVLVDFVRVLLDAAFEPPPVLLRVGLILLVPLGVDLDEFSHLVRMGLFPVALRVLLRHQPEEHVDPVLDAMTMAQATHHNGQYLL